MISLGRKAVDIRRADASYRTWEAADNNAKDRNDIIAAGVFIGLATAILGTAARVTGIFSGRRSLF